MGVDEERVQGPAYKRRIRKLRQYKDMTDDEFDKIWDDKLTGLNVDKEFESRIQKKIDDFAADYDLDDLKSNDKLVLRALAQASLTLEDLEKFSYLHRLDNLDSVGITELRNLQETMSKIRGDISKMQDDLSITRRVRKGDKEESVLSYLENLKSKAKQFYQSRMFYIYCEKCNMLLATTWFLWPEETNKMSLHCKRCGEKVVISSKELLDKRGVNVDNVPDTFK